MNCEQVQALLVAYLDGEVTPSEKVLIQTHLSDCTVCQQELTLLSTARNRLRTVLQQRTVHVSPSQDAWSRLEARLTEAAQPSPAHDGSRHSRPAPGASPLRSIQLLLGGVRMNKRFFLAGGVAILAIALAAVLMFKSVTPVSAQQILDRASAAQSAAKTAQGIWHTFIEEYQNPLAIEGDQAGTTITDDDYVDAAKGYYRMVTQDDAGNTLQIVAYDGSFTYSAQQAPGSAGNVPLTVHRVVQDQKNDNTGRSTKAAAGLGDPAADATAIFDQFRTNPRVELQGKQTWTDGRQVYVLVDSNFQTHKQSNGQDDTTFTGAMKMVFDAQTYQLIESELTTHKDGKDIVIERVLFLVNEALPSGSHVAWDLSDLQGITFVDDPKVVQAEDTPQVISEQELAAHVNAYVLKTIPDGFTEEITALPNQPKDQPYTYEINYRNQANEVFGLQAVGILQDGFVAASFYDGSYKTASGLVLYYSSSRPNNSPEGTSAMLTLPDGTSDLLISTMSREQVQALVEDMVPLK